MSAVRVKICGVTRLEDALQAGRLGADALGFNFWPKSKRFIVPDAAAAIVRQLPPFVSPVGVFVNQSKREIVEIARRVGLRALQLHGDESPAFCRSLDLPVIKAIHVANVESLAMRAAFEVAAFLLDTADHGFGGSGRVFDWRLLRTGEDPRPLILAGGLTPQNVARAVAVVRPYGVDVASGVESAPGIKDSRKMASFIRRAKGHE